MLNGPIPARMHPWMTPRQFHPAKISVDLSALLLICHLARRAHRHCVNAGFYLVEDWIPIISRLICALYRHTESPHGVLHGTHEKKYGSGAAPESQALRRFFNVRIGILEFG